MNEGLIGLKTNTLSLATPTDFNFWHTVNSHGWCSLLPFSVNKEHRTINRILTIDDGMSVSCQISDAKQSSLCIQVNSGEILSKTQSLQILRQLADCFRLTEDYFEFYREVKLYPKYRWIAKMKIGRMLRAPSVFEDVVKMICTTNCNWSLTEIMIGNLVRELGIPFDDSQYNFPSPEAIAGTTEQFLRKSIKAGYRSPFLLEFAQKVASGTLDIEHWRSTELSTEVLFKELRSIKGVGEYAAGNILKLLGRYDYLGLDSWVRDQYYKLYHNGRKVNDRTIEQRYKPYGKWRGLIFWMEMTKNWYDHKSPF